MVMRLDSISMRARFRRTLCTRARVLLPVASRTCRDSVRCDMASSSASACTLGGLGRAASMRATSRAISALPLASMAGTTNGACAWRPSISSTRPTASASATPKRVRSRCSIRSVCAKAAPAVVIGPSAHTMRSASTVHAGSHCCSVGASHQDVVTQRPGSTPAACSRNTAEHDAATCPPAATCAARARAARRASSCARRVAITPAWSRPTPGTIHVLPSGRGRFGKPAASTCMPLPSCTLGASADRTRQVGRGAFTRGASVDAACRMSSVAATLVAYAPESTRMVKSAMTKVARKMSKSTLPV
ncbi:hypothetical protein COLO4_02014 [Corchorus olitorius]|uniref:Uncharacterized protein n=1 Tax=Corchorus olitorius TaxID=93759 RepID=A0A1R3L1S9_9ROSI|nr:hypothetical protein COLO4_02014 [Corchorus olitorius]